MRFPSAKQAVSSFAAILTARKLGCRPICGCPAASPPESCSRRSHPQAPRLRSHQVPQHPRRVSALDVPAEGGYGPRAFQPISSPSPQIIPFPYPAQIEYSVKKTEPPAVLIFVLFALFVAILSVARVGRRLHVSTPDCCAVTPWFGPKLNHAEKFLAPNLRLLPPSLYGSFQTCVSGSPSVAGLHHDWSGTPPD